MTFSFFDFTMAVTKWLSTAPDEARERLKPSSWKTIYSTADKQGEHLAFSPDTIARVALDGDAGLRDRVAVPLADMLNQRFGAPQASPPAEPPAEESQAASSPAAEPPAAESPASRQGTPPPAQVPPPRQEAAAPTPAPPAQQAPAPQAPQARPVAGTVPAAGPAVPAPAALPELAPEAPPPAPAWVFPDFDYSRPDRDQVGVEGGTHHAVTVQRVDGTLLYRWEDPGEGEVYRVVVSDTEDPYVPDDFEQVAVTEDLEARDTTPPTTAVRFVTVWGYTRPSSGTSVLGQGRRVASAVVVHPLQEWTLSFDTMTRAVEGRWNPPTAPADGQVTVLTARLPVDKPVGRYLRGMAWLSCQIPNNGAGFQDSDGLVGGRKHTYVAAVEVTVSGQTYTSAPQVAHITPELVREAVTDLSAHQQAQGAEGVRGTLLSVTWTQNPLSDVVVYRTDSPVDAAALAQGTLATSQLESAGLKESDVITSAAGLSATEDPNRQLRTLEKVVWPEGSQWDTCYLTPVTRHEDGTSTIGTPVQLKRAGGIRNATLRRRGSWDLVTFTWPGDATSVELRALPVDQPFDPDVPPLVSVNQDRYRTDGGCMVPGGLPAEGSTVYLNSLTYHGGQQITSAPVSLEAPPLWRYRYTLKWPLMKKVTLFGALVEVEVVSQVGITRQDDAVGMSLVYNPDHFPLHAGDGQPVPLYLERPTKDGGQETHTAVLLPPHGVPMSMWFDHKDLGPGYVRLLVNARPAVAGTEGHGHALECYALTDPPLSLLRKR